MDKENEKKKKNTQEAPKRGRRKRNGGGTRWQIWTRLFQEVDKERRGKGREREVRLGRASKKRRHKGMTDSDTPGKQNNRCVHVSLLTLVVVSWSFVIYESDTLNQSQHLN